MTQLTYAVREYTSLMQEAEEASSRKEAVSLLRKAARLRDTLVHIHDKDHLAS